MVFTSSSLLVRKELTNDCYIRQTLLIGSIMILMQWRNLYDWYFIKYKCFLRKLVWLGPTRNFFKFVILVKAHSWAFWRPKIYIFIYWYFIYAFIYGHMGQYFYLFIYCTLLLGRVKNIHILWLVRERDWSEENF